jgi:hypothetical protein
MSRQLTNITYAEDGSTHSGKADLRTVTVEVSYSNGRVDEFDAISREAYFQWQNSGFDDAHTPSSVFIREPIGEPEPEELEDDIENEESDIPNDDFLGQVTGIPTAAFGGAVETAPIDAKTRLVQSGRIKIHTVRESKNVR